MEVKIKNPQLEVITGTQKIEPTGTISIEENGEYDVRSYANANVSVSGTDVQINGNSITSDGIANIVTNGAYDASTNTIATMSDIPDMNNYQTKIDSSHKLSADLISDGTTNKIVTATEKSTWSGKQDALVSGTNIKTINNTSILGSGNISAVSSTDITTISKLTQTQYNALTTKDSNTLYIIVG